MPFVNPKESPATEHDERKRLRDCASLELQLTDPSPAARRWAAKDLANCPGATSALVAQLQNEPERSVRAVILTSLTELGDDEAIAGMVACLRSEDAAIRNEAIETMKLLPNQVSPIMANLLDDPDPDVRIFTVNILESLRSQNVEEWLKTVILHDDHVNVCAAAVDLLGEVATSASREALQGLKERFPDEPFIAFAADVALKRIDTP